MLTAPVEIANAMRERIASCTCATGSARGRRHAATCAREIP
jgi:hypothetical protein